MHHGIFFLTVVALLLAPPGASAHSAASPPVPRDGAALSAPPKVLRLQFTGPMRVTSFKLVGPDGAVPLARADGMKPVTTLEATPDGKMVPGAYAIEWRGMSTDGHIMKGSSRFTIAP